MEVSMDIYICRLQMLLHYHFILLLVVAWMGRELETAEIFHGNYIGCQ